MRKIYSLALMAAALLVSANGWATNEAKIGTQEYATLGEAFFAVTGTEQTRIELLSDVSLTSSVQLTGGKNIILDLGDGNTITLVAPANFTITQSSLDICGKGSISTAETYGWRGIFNILGADVPNDGSRTYLHLGKDVEVNGAVGSANVSYGCWAIGIFPTTNKHAYGVDIFVEGTISAYCPMTINGQIKDKTENIPTIHIASTAELTTGLANNCSYTNPSDVSNAIYAAGYAKWNIEGTVRGCVGIYAKAGDITIGGNAMIEGFGPYVEPQKNTSGTNGSAGNGDAIIYASDRGYGDLKLTITGNANIYSENGYALHEASIEGEETHVGQEDFNIISGKFSTGENGMGAIKTTAEIQEQVKVEGAIKGGQFSDETIKDFIDNINGTIMVIKDQDGKDKYIVSDITTDQKCLNTFEGATKEHIVTFNGTNNGVVPSDMEIAYLFIEDEATVTVPAGKTLTVGGVMAKTAKAQFIVEAGAKVIITNRGITALYENNILLQTKEGAEAILLFAPTITIDGVVYEMGNTHPLATIEFKSKSWRKADGSDKVYDRFGIPTYGALTSIKSSSTTAPTAVMTFNNTNAKWEVLGYINQTPAIDAAKMNVPFQYYQFLTNSEDKNGVTITMTGQLVGILNPTLSIRANSWNGFANSYIGNMDVETLFDGIPNGDDNIEKAVYLYYNVGTDDNPTYTWTAYNRLLTPVKYLKPMQSFLLLNEGGAASAMDLNYEALVWNHKDTKYMAPARRKITAREEISKVSVNVAFAEGGSDMVLLAEDAQFSPAKDRGYDAVKYMNENVNIYVSAEQKMCVWATDELNGTYLGFSCVKGGIYTITFDCENDEDMVLTDLQTGKRVQMAEGMSYQFDAEANTTDDYRFLVSKAPKVVTGIENVQEDIKAAGIYSITGQYLGAMSEWNNMPQGIYIVNGEKKIK